MAVEDRAKLQAEHNGKLAPDSSISARVMSHAPGRLRFRVAAAHRHPATLTQIANSLQSHFHIQRVRSNPHNGSITVYYDRDRASHEQIYRALQDLDIIFATAIGGKSEAATDLAEAIADLNRRVGDATDGTVDLRFLVPLGFGTLALRQLIVKGLQLEFIPWYVLAWYAFDSFIKLHYTSDPDAPAVDEPR
jgi:hypothetical protein